MEQWKIEVFDEPYRYVVIDNYLPEDAYQAFKDDYLENFDLYYYDPRRKEIPEVNRNKQTAVADDGTLYGIGEWTDIAKNNFHLDEDFLKKYFPEHRGYSELSSLFTVNISKEGHVQKIHDEVKSKVLSAICYIAPEESIGTLLYDGDKKFHTEVKWKPNRCVIMAGITGKTWHNFKAPSDKWRITFNAFLNRTDEDVERFGR